MAGAEPRGTAFPADLPEGASRIGHVTLIAIWALGRFW
jgi:hypothetical protein